MAGRYGMSFASRFIEAGQYEEAVVAATKAAALDDENPEPLVERASAYALLERYAEAVTDFERAIELDSQAEVLEIDVVDDSYFSALLGAARHEATHSVDAGCMTLARYRSVLPAGRHLADVTEWSKRLRRPEATA